LCDGRGSENKREKEGEKQPGRFHRSVSYMQAADFRG
jgi:hypothetical protein